jgi:hypothetical protein
LPTTTDFIGLVLTNDLHGHITHDLAWFLGAYFVASSIVASV